MPMGKGTYRKVGRPSMRRKLRGALSSADRMRGVLSDSDVKRMMGQAQKKGASTSRLRDLIRRRRRKPAKRTAKRGAMSTKDMVNKLRGSMKRGTGRGAMSDSDMAMYRRMMARRRKK